MSVHGSSLINMTNFGDPSEVLLSAKSSPGDQESWRALRQHLKGLVRNQLPDRLRGKVDESDLVQISLLEVQRYIRRFEGKTSGEINVWLKKIVKHNLIDICRAYSRTGKRNIIRESPITFSNSGVLIDSGADTASSIFSRAELDLELIQAVASLPRNQQHLLECRHRHGWTFAQIGKELGITEQAARKRWHRIVELLRAKLVSKQSI